MDGRKASLPVGGSPLGTGCTIQYPGDWAGRTMFVLVYPLLHGMRGSTVQVDGRKASLPVGSAPGARAASSSHRAASRTGTCHTCASHATLTGKKINGGTRQCVCTRMLRGRGRMRKRACEVAFSCSPLCRTCSMTDGGAACKTKKKMSEHARVCLWPQGGVDW